MLSERESALFGRVAERQGFTRGRGQMARAFVERFVEADEKEHARVARILSDAPFHESYPYTEDKRKSQLKVRVSETVRSRFDEIVDGMEGVYGSSVVRLLVLEALASVGAEGFRIEDGRAMWD